MSVWARNEQRRLVRIAPPRNYEESIISQLFQDNPTPQMDHPGNQQPLFNENSQGIPVNPQGLHEPPQHGDGVTLPVAPAIGGEMLTFSEINIGVPLLLYLMWKELSERFCNLNDPQQTHVFANMKRLTNSS